MAAAVSHQTAADSRRIATASRKTAIDFNRTAARYHRTGTIPHWATFDHLRPPVAQARTAVTRPDTAAAQPRLAAAQPRTAMLRCPRIPPHDALRSAMFSAVRNCAFSAPETRSVNSSTSILPISADEP